LSKSEDDVTQIFDFSFIISFLLNSPQPSFSRENTKTYEKHSVRSSGWSCSLSPSNCSNRVAFIISVFYETMEKGPSSEMCIFNKKKQGEKVQNNTPSFQTLDKKFTNFYIVFTVHFDIT
jgi:hypothetical protein